MKRHFLLFSILLSSLFIVSTLKAQTGYYRTAATGDWDNTAIWEYSADNISFNPVGAEGYPGEQDIPTVVWVRDGHIVTLNTSPANSLKMLNIGEGVSGQLLFGNDGTSRSLTVSDSLQIFSGAAVSAGSNAIHQLILSKGLLADGTLSAYTNATQAINVTFNGSTATDLKGSGAVTFNKVTFNRTALLSIGINLSIQDEFSITNIGRVDVDIYSITGVGGANTFSMTTGEFRIGGTNTFPGGFETINLTGGTVIYGGKIQTIASQDAIGGPLSYYSLQLEEDANNNTYVKSLSGDTEIKGSMLINGIVDGQARRVELDMGSYTITVGGNWIQVGSILATVGTSTVDFNGNGFSQIQGTANFYDFKASGGGTLSIGVGSTTNVESDFLVTGNTTIVAVSAINIGGDFDVQAGSSFSNSAGTVTFNGTGAQSINVTNASFYSAYFRYGAPNKKTITGNLNLTYVFMVYDDASVEDAVPGQNHTFVYMRPMGEVNFKGSISFTNYLYHTNDGNPHTVDLGTVDIIAESGANLTYNTILETHGNFTVNSGTFTINEGSELIGNGGTLTVYDGNTLRTNTQDGFPDGFATYNFEPTSVFYYGRADNQIIRSQNYGALQLGGGGIKTFDGDITTSTSLYLLSSVVVNAGAYNHVFRDRIRNAASSNLTSTGSITIYASDGANYRIIEDGTYNLKDLTIDTDAQTGSYIYNINSNLLVNGNLTLLNSGGDALNVTRIEIYDKTVTNNLTGTFSVGANVILATSGLNSLQNSLNSFGSNSFDINSTVYYYANGNQTVTNKINPYGNLMLAGNSGNKTASGALNVNGKLEGVNQNGYVFVLGNYTHHFKGDYSLRRNNTNAGTSTVIFDGANQHIDAIGNQGWVDFYHVTFAGTGTKILEDNYEIKGDIIINAGVTVDASSHLVDFNVWRNWTNNGTFNQSNGTTNFIGTSGNQNINSGSNTNFGAVTINKPSGTQRVTLTTDIKIGGNLRLYPDNEFRTGNYSTYLSGNIRIDSLAYWNQSNNSTLYMIGGNEQLFQMYDPNTVFKSIVFQNSGEKRIYRLPITGYQFVIDGSVDINSGATFNGGGFVVTITGHWTNNGSFVSTGGSGRVIFNGANQTINTSTFNNLELAGTGTKTLGGGITTARDIDIDVGVSFDVSASNFPITVGINFTNNGTFVERNGKITFSGANNGTLMSGTAEFYNLDINKTGTNYITLTSPLTVKNTLNVATGRLRTGAHNLYAFGSLIVDSNAIFEFTNSAAEVHLNATSGTHSFQSGNSTFYKIFVNAPGAVYNLLDNLTMANNMPFTMQDGTFNVNHNTMTLQGGAGAITINGGTFSLDDNAILQVANTSSINNNGGIFKVVGLPGNPARIQRQGGAGGYSINQTAGTFHARYYEIFHLRYDGITISGGSIDNTNNFSDGRFTDPYTGTAQFLQLTGLNVTGLPPVDNVVFNAGATYNVTRTSGTGVITFEDASGARSGALFENDPSNLIDWTYPAGILWTGLGGTDEWNNGANWSSNSIPNNVSNILLDHAHVSGAYTVKIDAADAFANRIILDTEGGNAISLEITNGYDFTVGTFMQISAGAIVKMDHASSVLEIAESFENSGSLNFTNGLLRFNGTTGSHLLKFGNVPPNNPDPIYNLEIDANGALYTLSSALNVTNDINLIAGLLDVSNNNYAINVGGNWSNIGLNTFEARSGTVNLNKGGTTTQTISGGPFYNLTASNSSGSGLATKQLSANVATNNTVLIDANAKIDGQSYNLYVGGNWTNNASTSALSQTGIGTVIFNRAGNQSLDNGSFATTFNNLEIAGSGTVTLFNNTNVNGDVMVSSGVFSLSTFDLTGIGGSNSFTLSGSSSMYLLANNFPSTFENIDIVASSTVQYRANTNQDIYPTTYGNLTLLRNNAGNLQTKTATGDFNVLGAFVINDVDTEFNLNGYKMTVTGGISAPVGGRTILWGNGTVEQNNLSAFNLNANIPEWPNLIFSGAGSKTLYTDITVTGNLSVQNGVILNMRTFKITGTSSGKAFNVDNGGRLYCTIPAPDVAFPSGFDSYNLAVNSEVRLDSDDPQILYTGVTYGNLLFRGLGSVETDGINDLYVDGNFDTYRYGFDDSGKNLYLSGNDIQLNTYVASPGVSLVLAGTSQVLRETYNNTPFDLQNIVFGGTGTKTLTDGGDAYVIKGNVTVQADVTVNITRNVTFTGALFTDNGSYNQSGGTLTFGGFSNQSIVSNSNTVFYSLVFNNFSTTDFTSYGANIRGNITVESGSTLNFGNFDYLLGYTGSNFIVSGSLVSANANFTFDGVNPYFPANFVVNNMTLNTSGNAYMSGNLDVNGDLYIGYGFRVANAAYNLKIGGDFINDGSFNDYDNTTTFNSSRANVTIQTNGDRFYNLNLVTSGSTEFKLTSSTNYIDRTFLLNTNATLNVNGKDLNLGINTPSGKTATINGTLDVGAGGRIITQNQGMAYQMVVNGTLKLVGTPLNITTFTSSYFTNALRTSLRINSGGKIEAKNYLVEYLDEDGLVLANGSTVDATNNFSDGAWSNIITANSGGPYYYLQTNNVAIPGTINNITFGFVGTPTIGRHYNVQRSNSAPTAITFSGTITGILAGETFEDDGLSNKIIWPILSSATWTGNYNNDWHVGANWSTLSVPVSSTDVTIPIATNNPEIGNDDAVCKDLTITNGAVILKNSKKLTVEGNLVIGTGSNAGALIVSSSSSVIEAKGGWVKGANGIFTHGNGTVKFTASSGSVTITPVTAAFYNVDFDGAATFQLTGTNISFKGNVNLNDGMFSPISVNYHIYLTGNLTRGGGDMNYATAGTYHFDGANQTISKAKMHYVEVMGSATKTFTDSTFIFRDLTIASTLETDLSTVLDINRHVVINAGGTFKNTGGGTHTVAGSWTNNGTYSGTGVIKFDGTGTQTINTSHFAAVELENTGVKLLGGNLTLAGDLTMKSSSGYLDLGTYTVTGAGTMTAESSSVIYVKGANNFPNFSTYNIDPVSYTDYRSTSNQIIRGGVAYGILRLYNGNTKTLDGNIIVQNDLRIYESTLDVSSNNYSINIAGHFNNQDVGSFIPRLGDVVFDGDSNTQYIYTSLTGQKAFYKLSVNKNTGGVYVVNQNLEVKNNLTISSGAFSANGFVVTIGGSFNNTGGTFARSGKYIFNSTSGTETIRSGGSRFNEVDFNGNGTTFKVLDTFDAGGNILIASGSVFDGNAQRLNLGDDANDIVTLNGILEVDANSILALGGGTSLTVNTGGTAYIVGSPGNPAVVTSSAGRYYFLVNGTIHAKNYLFENMAVSGIQVSSSGTINVSDNFSEGTFTNGASGGTFLRVENTQSLAIDNVSFPTNPGGAASNVKKIDTNVGTLTFTNANGAFAGESFDDDPNDLIIWPTPVVLTWIGGTSTDWFTASNWSASAGPSIVPTGAENVIINPATNQPVINTSGAITNNITINAGAKLTMNTVNEPGDDFVIQGNLNLFGNLTATSPSDTIYIAGSWTRTAPGAFVNGSGTVIFNGSAGSHTINNTGSTFHNLTINATASYSLAAATTIQNNLDIISGTFDVSSGNYALSVNNKWTNTGTFNPRSGAVTLTRTTAGTVDLNNGASSFYHLIIDGGASTNYLVGNNLTVNGNFTINNSTVNLNGKTLVMGDGVGTDILNITGTFIVDANASVKMGSGASIQVQSGGKFRAVGSNASNIATITRNTGGTYSFLIAGGGTLEAQYYSIGFIGANGLQMSSGAILGSGSENLSDGTFTNGTPGGRYLEMLGLTTSNTIRNVVFNSGPAKNVKATSGSGKYVEFEDASGLMAGSIYEDDDGAAHTGFVRWTSTSTQYTWTGSNGTNWNDLSNWLDGNGLLPIDLPDQTIDIIIPNTLNKPIISSSDAETNNLTIQTGGNLTLNTNKNLTIAANFTNGGTFTIPNGSNSTLSIGENYSNAGTVNLGNQSTVELKASTGVKSLAFGGSSLHNLTLNGAATFNLTTALVVNGNLTISNGTLDVTTNNYQISVGGNWTNNGIFNSRGGRVIINGTGAQSINAGGLGADKRFYDLRIAKSNTATLISDVYVIHNMELNSGSFNLGSATLEVAGAWTNTNVTVIPSTSTVVFSGSNSIAMGANSQQFNNLTINKTGNNQVDMSANASVNGILSVASGTFYLNGRRLDYGNGAVNMDIDGTLYVDAGSVLGMHQSSSIVVNSGGVLRVTGTNDNNVATVTRKAATSGWNMTINGELRSRFALFEYSGGNGITLGSTATLHATDNLSNTTFRNGIGTSYITNNSSGIQNVTIADTKFEAGPTYNVSASTGDLTIHNYEGTLAGARFENDNSPTHPGFVKWTYHKTKTTNAPGTINFGNEVVLTLTSVNGLTSTDVELVDDIYLPSFNVLPRTYRITYAGGTATGNIVFAYADNEMGSMVEDDLKIWVHKGNIEWQKLNGTLDKVNKTLTISGYTFGEGTANETIPKSKAGSDGMPEILDGSEHFVVSDRDTQESLPVELTDFSINADATGVGKTVLAWTTASEKENYGFYLSRSYLGFEDEPQIDGFSARRDTSWTELTFVQGRGNSTEEVNYTFTDDSIQEAGNYLYRLTQMDFDGKVKAYDPIEYHYAGPEKFELKQNYPNPFNPTTIIPYNVAKRAHVRIDVFNILGQRVQTLVNEVRNPGSYRIDFNGMAYSSGMYLIRYSADGKTFVKKMMLIK